MHLNCRSIFKKIDQIALIYKNVDVIWFSETWLTSMTPDRLLNIEGKTLYRLDRIGKNLKSRGAGVCIYLNNKLSAHCKLNGQISTCTSDFEILSLNITRPDLRHITVTCLYRPPTGKIKQCIDYLKIIFSGSRNEQWILGDFNINFLDRNNKSRSKFLTLFKTHGLNQLIHDITRPNIKGGTCID